MESPVLIVDHDTTEETEPLQSKVDRELKTCTDRGWDVVSSVTFFVALPGEAGKLRIISKVTIVLRKNLMHVEDTKHIPSAHEIVDSSRPLTRDEVLRQ
jgi:hypothetical protein